jgi:hypothetical protein
MRSFVYNLRKRRALDKGPTGPAINEQKRVHGSKQTDEERESARILHLYHSIVPYRVCPINPTQTIIGEQNIGGV